jgi:peptidoglycan/LPS O-acetylase OafA/YrhL
LSNAYFSQQWNADLSTLSVVRDGTINALFLGYSDEPGVAFLSPWQQTIEQSFVAPLWTLSIEFYGSVAILFLCLCARRSRRLWWTAMVLGTFFMIRSAYICFLVGHLLAFVRHAERPVSKHKLLPMALVITGVACCVVTDVWQPEWLIALCSDKIYWLFPGQLPAMQQKALGAVLVLTGIIDLQLCRDFLSKPWLVAYSRLSFPIYLIHWPIMCGLAATAFVYLNKIIGMHLAQMCALALGIATSAVASVGFAAVDRCALDLSSRLRRRADNLTRSCSMLASPRSARWKLPSEVKSPGTQSGAAAYPDRDGGNRCGFAMDQRWSAQEAVRAQSGPVAILPAADG